MAKVHVFIQGPDTIHRISFEEREPLSLAAGWHLIKDVAGAEVRTDQVLLVIKGDDVEHRLSGSVDRSVGVG